MGINSRIAKIPFFVLYLVLAAMTSYNWIRVILLQGNFEAFQYTQPWDYYLSRFFVATFGVSQRQYFIFAFPVILLALYLVPKALGKLLNMDKTSNVKGDNHVGAILILLMIPSTLGLHKLFIPDWKVYFLPGIILVILFSIWSWADERKHS